MTDHLSWTDVHEIGFRLAETHPQVNPLSVRFTDLRRMVEQLPGFTPLPGQSVNEQILEAIQHAWHEEWEDSDHGEDADHYAPPTPYKP